MSTENLVIHTDGASRGNPGRAACGVVIADEKGEILSRLSRYIGIATNNQAEYQAVIAALEEALRLGARRVSLYADSELVVRQLNGRYRVKNESLKPLYLRVKELAARLQGFTVTHVMRDQNTLADGLANQSFRDAGSP
ncbi:MAG: ribonuclease HI family protein [Chloroflexota bacterium]